MRVISQFTLQAVSPAPAEGPTHSRLLFEGQLLDTIVDGSCLEAQFALDEGYLLMTTADVPYEEVLKIYLLNSRFDIRDEMELGAPYTPGILDKLRIVALDQLEFSFSGSDRWQLKVRTMPLQWIYSLMHWGAGADRVSGRRYMVLSRVTDF